MKHLISIQTSSINSELIQTVNARDLHKFLESKQKFIDWVQNRIEKYDFIEGEDFIIILGKTPEGGRPAKEYHITFDMAKELSMVERNAKGKEARQYFIECEKKLIAPKQLINDNLPEYRKAKAIEIRAKALQIQMANANKLFELMPNLSPISKQAVLAGLINPIAGGDIIPAPLIEEKYYSATEIGEMLNKSANAIGKITNILGLKTEEYGQCRMSKSLYSSKQVETWVYNQKAVEAIKDYLTC